MELEEKRGFPIALVAGAGAVLLFASGVYLLTQKPGIGGSAPEQRLAFEDIERAYVEQIHFSNLEMSRASNLLEQKLTYLVGVVSNEGARTIREMDVSIEFRDSLNQVVLRETRRMISARGLGVAPLPGGQRRQFQLTFEHVPADWNQNYPSLTVTGLLLE